MARRWRCSSAIGGGARKAGAAPDVLLLCDAIRTSSRSGATARSRIFLATEAVLRRLDVEFHPTNRGGDITYHGPGQLVAYPIVHKLAEIRRDVAWYVRQLEQAMIEASAAFGSAAAFRVAGRTGVWARPGRAAEEKLGAIGVHISRWVTSHGLAYNVSTDLRYFDLIVPCGIAGRRATSLETLVGRAVPNAEFRGVLGGRAGPCAGCRHRAHGARRTWRRARRRRDGRTGLRRRSLRSRRMSVPLSREQSLELYYYLRLNRALDELLARLFRQNKLFGGLYGSRGQEAISVGAAYALGPGDWMAPMIRNIGALLVRGFRPRRRADAAHGALHVADQGPRRHQPFRRPWRAPCGFAHLHVGRSHSRHDRRSHGGSLPRAEDRGHDVDR